MNKSLQFAAAIIFSLSTNVHAQFNTVWKADYQHTTSNDFSNESRKVVSDASGNVFVLADVTSNIDPLGNLTASTYHYTVISKYSTAGVFLLSKSINVANHFVAGFDNKGAFGLEIDANGDLFIGYTSYDGVTNFDANIAKYKGTNLVRLWNRRFNPTSVDKGIDLG